MRTFDQIRQQIVDEKNSKLPEASSDSLTAVWWIWANIVALAIYTFEQIVYTENNKLIEETQNKRYGTTQWYSLQAKNFQLGDPLVFDSETGQIYYDQVYPEKQIVKRASVDETTDGTLIIKVAKEDSSGLLAPLDPLSELPLLVSYIQQIKVAGVVIDTLSQAPDTLDGVAQIYYDGNYLKENIKIFIETALTQYRDNLPFNGVLLKNELIDVLRVIEGIDDVLFTTLTAQPTGGSTTDIIRDYNTKAGYFNYQDNWLDNWVFIPRYENPSS